MTQDYETPFTDLFFNELTVEEMNIRAKKFFEKMNKRRTTRHFSDRHVSRELIEIAIKTASTAPSGAHLQPWTFVAISNQKIKNQIRKKTNCFFHKNGLLELLGCDNYPQNTFFL